MVRGNLIRGLMAEKGIQSRYLSDKMGISQSTFNTKMRKGKFGSDEIKVLIDELSIPQNRWKEIFFS